MIAPSQSRTAAPRPSREERLKGAAQPATVATTDGEFVTGGIASITATSDAWSATLTQLDRPGAVASAYFVQGVREVVVRLEDGRRARAQITGTSFIASADRICRVRGLEPLA